MEQLSLAELTDLAYIFQIDFTPPLTEDDREYIVNQINRLKENVIDWEEFITQRKERRENQGKSCYEPKTYIGQKDVNLLSDEELVFMPDDDKHYCFDRFDDVDPILNENTNPFNRKELTPEQVEILENSKHTPYPYIYVDELPDEIDNRLHNNDGQYVAPLYVSLSQTLAGMIESVGLKYEAEQVLIFGSDLLETEYNLFIKHKPINQQINLQDKSRNDVAAEALNFIVNYLRIKEQMSELDGNTAKVEIGKAIDEFMHMRKNHLDYEQLLEERGEYNDETGLKELYWRPSFMNETNGEVISRYYVNEADEIHGLYTIYYLGGRIMQQGLYQHNIMVGEWDLFDPYGNMETIDVVEGGLIKQWFNDSNILMGTYEVKNGMKNGRVIRYTPTGDKHHEGQYIDNKPVGIWTQYNGEIVKIDHNMDTDEYLEYYDDGAIMVKAIAIGLPLEKKFDGLYQQYYNSGKVNITQHYEDGLRNGLFIEYDDSNQHKLIERGYFIDDYKEGEFRGYLNGKLAYITFYKNGNVDGKQRRYINGVLTEKINYENGMEHGKYRLYYITGEIETKGRYNNGVKDGLWVTYHKNGNLKNEGFYVDDAEDGIWVDYYKNGTPKIIQEFTLIDEYPYSVNINTYETYYDNGMVKEIGKYIVKDNNSVKNGKWTSYNQDGSVTNITNYLDGKKNGEYLVYNNDQQLITKGNYLNDNEAGIWYHYYDNGILKSEGTYIEGIKHDYWKKYYLNGNLKSEGYYDYGQKDGEWKTYYDNGKIKSAGLYEHGVKVGKWEKYDLI